MSKKLLEQFVKESFIGTNNINYFISERGNQRIEIKNVEDGEIWQTLEATSKSEDPENYDDISQAMLSGLLQQS